MQHRWHMAAVAAFSTFWATSAGAQSYDLSVYSPPANPWQLKLVSTEGGAGSTSNVYELSNIETGAAPRSVTVGSSEYVQVNRRGELLKVSMPPPIGGQGANTGTLSLDGQYQTTQDSILFANLRDDGSVRAVRFVWMNGGTGHQTDLFAHGKWHSYAPAHGSSITNPVVNGANSRGDTVGGLFSQASDSKYKALAVINGTEIALPCAPGSAFGCANAANWINDKQVVVGVERPYTDAGEFSFSEGGIRQTLGPSFGTIWDASSGSRNLNALIAPGSALFGKAVIDGATEIDDLGNILAYGHMLDAPGTRVQFSLTAVPEPGTFVLTGLGLLAMASTARRRT